MVAALGILFGRNHGLVDENMQGAGLVQAEVWIGDKVLHKWDDKEDPHDMYCSAIKNFTCCSQVEGNFYLATYMDWSSTDSVSELHNTKSNILI